MAYAAKADRLLNHNLMYTLLQIIETITMLNIYICPLLTAYSHLNFKHLANIVNGSF